MFGFAFLAIDVMAAFTQMLTRGVFETVPEAAVHRARIGGHLDLGVARPPGPQVRGDEHGHPD